MKNSRFNVLFTLVGVLFVIGSLFAVFFAFIEYIRNSLTGLWDNNDEYFFEESALTPDDIAIVDKSE